MVPSTGNDPVLRVPQTRVLPLHQDGRLVGVSGFEPDQEQSSTAKGIIRPSRVPTPTPINGGQ